MHSTCDSDPPRILIAEDMIIEALAVEEAVREIGAAPVGPVARADEVVEVTRRERVDAAVLDVNLGGDLVFGAADELVRRGVPVLFVTGYDRSRFPDRFRQAPWLSKPYVPEKLEAMLLALLAAGR
ncbi:MAG TPA: hypothetical protein VFZ01_13200 [Geminicoccaceae bacterium]